MCEFHDCNCNGLGDIWWTDKCMYFSSIDDQFVQSICCCIVQGLKVTMILSNLVSVGTEVNH